MKTFIILCWFVAITIATPTTLELRSKWNEFKLTHGKTYENPIEEKKRMEIFAANVKKIEEHNKLYEQGLTTYKKGVNQFADWTREEFAAYLTKQKRVQHKALSTFQEPLNFKLPNEVDWRKKGCVTPVENQGECGACWAFSAVGALEGQNAIWNGKLVPLSEQELIDCSRSNAGCAGGDMDAAFSYVADYGLTAEQDYPYDAVNGTCRRDGKPIAVRTRGYIDVATGSESALQAAVALIGPVSVAVDALGWISYAGGIFTGPCNNTFESLDHGVLVVGYTEDYWIVKNSWGIWWGEDGFIRLTREQGACGITLDASYPLLANLPN